MNTVKAGWEFLRMRRNVWRPAAALRPLQAARLRRLVHHAYEHVPYYRELFRAAGVRPQDIRQPQDLAALPVTYRADLQDRPLAERVAHGTDLSCCTINYTSGSTGKPFAVILDTADLWRQSLGLLRSYMEIGYRPTDRYCCIAATPEKERFRYGVQRLGLFRSYYIPAVTGIEEQIQALRDFRPDFLISYPSNLRALAGHIQAKGIDDIQPRLLGSGAETLDPPTRHFVEAAFGARVHNLYSSVEFGSIAFECQAGHLHLNADMLIPEFLVDNQPAQPGQSAELVITSLTLMTAPLIRYSLGDMAKPASGHCSCGRGLPLMALIEGRCDERIKLRNGETIPGLYLTLKLRFITAIREFRIVQTPATDLVVELVGRGQLDADLIDQVTHYLRHMVKGQLSIHVRQVSALGRDPSGKLRSVVSYAS